MPTFQISGPDGRKYRVQGESPEGAMQALKKMIQGSGRSQHREFDGSDIPGYNPETGMVERQPPEASMPRTLATTMGAVEGVPVVGPYLRKGVENAAASVIAGVPGNPHAQGLISERPRDEVLSEVRGMTDKAAADHPYFNTAGSIAGGVAGTVPLVLAAPGLMGSSGGLVRQTLGSTLSGTALGAADSATRSGADAEAMKEGALWGLGLGALGPTTGRVVGAGLRKGIDYGRSFLPDGASSAERSFGRAVSDDAIEDIGAKMRELGPEGMPMDLGPNLRGQASAIAASPGKGNRVIREAVGARDAAANQRIRAEVDSTLGTPQVPSEIERSIIERQRALGPEYERTFQGAKAVKTEAIANQLESDIVNLRGDAQKAAQRVRKMLDVTGTDQLDPNPGTLFQTRQAIDGMMETATDSKVKAFLTKARKDIDAELARAVPNIKNVDAKYQELARQREGLQQGGQVFESGKTSMRPAELEAEFKQSAVPEGTMIGPSAKSLRLREGAVAEMDRIIGTNANDRVALQKLVKGEGDWNRDRLAILFGKDKADKLIKVVDRERTFFDTSNKVAQNSETAGRQAAQVELGLRGPEKKGAVRSALNINAGDAAASLIERMTGGARTAAKQKNMEELARLLTSRDPARIDDLTRRVLAAQLRGDITEQRAKQIIQGFALSSGSERTRKPLEITVNRPAGLVHPGGAVTPLR